MKSLAKKITSAVLAAATCFSLSTAMVNNNNASATIYSTVKLSYRSVTEAEALNNSSLSTDDIAVSINVTNLSQIRGFVIAVDPGSSLTIIPNEETSDNTSALVTSMANGNVYVGGAVDTSGVTGTVLATLYFEKDAYYTLDSLKSQISIDQLTDSNGADVNATVYQMSQVRDYRGGDVDGDGNVDAVDSSTVLSALRNHSVSSISANTVQNNLSSWFPNAGHAKAVDVDCNGYINATDSNLILAYFTASMGSNPMKSDIINKMGYVITY